MTDYAGFVAHIWWEEPGNFALASVLQEPGLLRDLCGGHREDLVAVLCNFFQLKQLEGWRSRSEIKKRSKSSVVILPPLPAKIRKVLSHQAQRMLQSVLWQLKRLLPELMELQCELPWSKAVPSPSTPSKQLRSPFMALSGRGDEFDSLTELCATLRHDLVLDPGMFPTFQVDEEVQWNAYLLGFYKHGQAELMEIDNKIPHTEYWQLLENFMFLLKALAAMAQLRYQRAQGRSLELGEQLVVQSFAAISAQFEANFRSIRNPV